VPLSANLDDTHAGLYAARPRRDDVQDASLGDLFRRLTSDTTELLRAEVELAKAEIRETGSRLAKDMAAIATAGALAFVGTLALTAFLIIAIGNALGGRYWLSSLLVGVIAAGAGYVMLQGALRDIREQSLKPEQTIASMRENAQWAREEAREVKRELTATPAELQVPASEGTSPHHRSP
jgi:uncharacterized membrane protein YqjE